MPKNSCDCPSPPGGRAECEAHQLAICRIVNNEPQMSCVDPPAIVATIEDLRPDPRFPKDLRPLDNWALAEILGQDRNLNDPVTDDERALLERGYTVVEGVKTTFKLPTGKAPTAAGRVEVVVSSPRSQAEMMQEMMSQRYLKGST